MPNFTCDQFLKARLDWIVSTVFNLNHQGRSDGLRYIGVRGITTQSYSTMHSKKCPVILLIWTFSDLRRRAKPDTESSPGRLTRLFFGNHTCMLTNLPGKRMRWSSKEVTRKFIPSLISLVNRNVNRHRESACQLKANFLVSGITPLPKRLLVGLWTKCKILRYQSRSMLTEKRGECG